MNISASTSKYVIGRVKSWISDEVKNVILIKEYKNLPTADAGVEITLYDGTKLMTEPVLYQFTSSQIYIETSKVICMDKITWEMINA